MPALLKKLFNKSQKKEIRNIQRLSSEWTKQFIGREEELMIFKGLLDSQDPAEWIIEIQGLGGVGKSTLLIRFAAIATSQNAKFALTDHRHKYALEVMQKLVGDLELSGVSFRNYNRIYKQYTKLKHQVLSDRNKPEQIIEWLGTGVSEIGSLVSKAHPAAELVMEAGGKDAVKLLTEKFSAYLYKKFSQRDVELLLRPEVLITKEFLNDIERVPESVKIVICFDTFEQSSRFVEPWLLNTLVPGLATIENAILVISGREPLSENWDIYRPVIREIKLLPFTQAEATDFLVARGMTNPKLINELYTVTKGLPLILQWESINPTDVRSTSGKINRFLNSINDEQLKESVIMCAIPRYFNKDVIKAMIASPNANEVFNLVKSLPGVFEREKYWEFHEIIRSSILEYKSKESPVEYMKYHQSAYEYYDAQIRITDPSTNKILVYLNDVGIEYLYHFLTVNEFEAIEKYLLMLAVAFARWDEEILSKLLNIAKQVHLEEKNEIIISRLIACKGFIDQRDMNGAIEGLESMASLENLPEDEKGMLLRSIGIIYANEKEYEKAREKFQEVINLLPQHPQAYVESAKLFLRQEKTKEAIKVYRFLVERVPNAKLEAITAIGLIYLEKFNYKEVEKIILELKEISPNGVEQFALTAALNEKQQAWESAITTHKAIAEKFPEHKVQAQFNVGRIYLILEDLDEVHKLGKNLITVYPNDPMGFLLMAAYYQSTGNEDAELSMLMEISKKSPAIFLPLFVGKQFEAIAQGKIDKIFRLLSDFQEITLDEEVLLGFGLTWRILGEEEKAIKVLRKILQQNPSSIIAHCNLGDIFWSKGDRLKATFHFEKAFSLNDRIDSIVVSLIALYEEGQQFEKADRLKKLKGLQEDSIKLLKHSLIGNVHLPIELFELRNELGKIQPGNLTDYVSQAGLFILLDMTEDLFKVLARQVEQIIGKDSAEAIAHSAKEFLANEPVEERKKILRAITLVISSPEDAFSNLSAVSNQGYVFLAERYHSVGLVASRMGKNTLAKKCFLNALKIIPDFPIVYLELGLLNLREGNQSEAYELFSKLIDEKLGLLLIAIQQIMMMEDYDFDTINNIILLVPETHNNLPSLYGAVGLNFLQQDKYDEAEKYFKKVLELDPSIQRAYFDLADIYQVQGRVDILIDTLEKSLLLAPDSMEAQQRLQIAKSQNDIGSHNNLPDYRPE